MNKVAAESSKSSWSTAALALSFLLVMPMARTARADSIAASNLPNEFQISGIYNSAGTTIFGDGPSANSAFAQPFVPSQSGRLSQLLVYLAKGIAGVPLKVSIRQDSAGLPGAVLGEASFAAALFGNSYYPPNPPMLLNFNALNVNLSAGEKYHVVFRTDTAASGGSYHYASHVLQPHSGSFGLPYIFSADGTATWVASPVVTDYEVAVAAYVVPEPTAAALAIATVLGFAALRRRVIGS